jgi:hypothetical protein
MLRVAKELCDASDWGNVELTECDAVVFTAPRPLNGVLLSQSHKTCLISARCCARHGIVFFWAVTSSSWTQS